MTAPDSRRPFDRPNLRRAGRWLALAAALLVPAAVLAFSGDGAKLFQQAKEELRTAARAKGGMQEDGDAVDHYERAADLLKDALAQATSPRETQTVKRALVSAYNDMAIELHSRRELARAVESARSAIEHSDDGSAVLESNIGTMYFEAGDYYNAAASWERAKELAGNAPLKESISRNLITAYIKDGQSRDRGSLGLAVREIEDILTGSPEDKEMLLLLGRTHQLEGESAKALDAWERARRLGGLPEDAERAYQQLKAAVAVKRGFSREESRHFNIDFNDRSHASLAGRLLAYFDEAHEELTRMLGLSTGDVNKVTITVYTNRQFDRAVRIAWAGGIQQANRVDLRVNPKWNDKDYEDTVRHEYCHYLVALKSLNKHVPAWLQEGFAMHQERALDRSFWHTRLMRGRAKGLFMPLSELENSFSSLPSEKVSLAYAQSHDFIGYLLERSGVNAIAKLLDAIGEGSKLEGSFESCFAISLADSERAWLATVDERLEAALAAARALALKGLRAAPSAVTATSGAPASRPVSSPARTPTSR
ncbi:MAG: hypothetical protein HYY25_12285 [Candidatus Wallbacteria bacterium]|nr:hypothetical protein [Candidatus Wallbacteria bacterium]